MYKTRQREAIQKVVTDSNRPLTAREICSRAGERVRGIGIATVYRTLKTLESEGLIRHLEIPGVSPHYEVAAKNHHHFFACEQCFRLFDLTGCLGGLTGLLPEGFFMHRHEIVIYGICRECGPK